MPSKSLRVFDSAEIVEAVDRQSLHADFLQVK
jgi:hypothetical protein